MWYIYIIKSLTKKYRYIGITTDPGKRLRYHNQGSNRSTKPFRPYVFIYLAEIPEGKPAALRKEKLIKSYKGGKALDQLIDSWSGGVVKRTSL